MTIVLDHTIVPARDKEESARFLAHIFGLEYNGPVSHFAPVRINDTLTIDFDNWDSFERHHYAFKVSEAEFDGIFDRVRGEGSTYGSGPRSAENMEINHRHGGRGFYFRDPNGHLLRCNGLSRPRIALEQWGSHGATIDQRPPVAVGHVRLPRRCRHCGAVARIRGLTPHF